MQYTAFKMRCTNCGAIVRLIKNKQTKNYLVVEDKLIETTGGECIITRHGDIIQNCVKGMKGFVSHAVNCKPQIITE